MEAGNRCFDENVPEEINRRIVDHISDVNLPYTEHARRNLINEGLKKDYVFVTGSPLPEVLHTNLHAIHNSDILTQLQLTPEKYILASIHREENIDNANHFLSLMSALNTAAQIYQFPIIFSTHPRTKKTIDAHNFKFHPLVQSVSPFGYISYNKLQANAFCVLSDSGSLAEEASLLNFPAISVRTATERPETIDKGNMLLGGIDSDSIINNIHIAKMLQRTQQNPIPLDYKDLNISDKITSIIASYTNIINKYIWQKA